MPEIKELGTPLYQAVGGVTYRLHLMVAARYVEMADGTSVETRINTIERSLSQNTTLRFADTIAGRDMLMGLAVGDECYVVDATADPDVSKGGAMYVWLPGRTWKRLYNIDLPVDGHDIAAAQGGLAVDSDGHIYVDMATLSRELKQRNCEAILKAGEALLVDSSGRIYLDVSKLNFSPLTDGQKAQILGGTAIRQLNFSHMLDSQKEAALSGTAITHLDFSNMTAAQKSDCLGDDAVTQLDFCQLTASQQEAILGGASVQLLDFARLTTGQMAAILGGNGITYLNFANVSEQQKSALFSGNAISKLDFSQLNAEQKKVITQTLVFTELTTAQKQEILAQLNFSQLTTAQKEVISKQLQFTSLTETQKQQLTQMLVFTDLTTAQKQEILSQLNFSQLTTTQKEIISKQIEFTTLTETQKEQLMQVVQQGQLSDEQIASIVSQINFSQLTTAQKQELTRQLQFTTLTETQKQEITKQIVLNNFTETQKTQLVEALKLAANGGLKFNSNKELYVDLQPIVQVMPETVRETIVQSLRVPIFLSGNLTFTVDKKATGATDAELETPVLRQTTPFKTIRACVKYVCENYNLGPYDITILVAGYSSVADYYDERLVLGDFIRTTGKIIIRGASWASKFYINANSDYQDNVITALPCGVRVNGGAWEMENFYANVNVNFTGKVAPSAAMYGINVVGGSLTLRQHGLAVSMTDVPKNASGQVLSSNSCYMYHANNATLIYDPWPGDSEAESSALVNQTVPDGATPTPITVLYADNESYVRFRSTSTANYNGRIKVVGTGIDTVCRINGGKVTAMTAGSTMAKFSNNGTTLNNACPLKITEGGTCSLGKNWGSDPFFPGNQSLISVDQNTCCWLTPSQG